MLEPQARAYVNIPQKKAAADRIDCQANDGSTQSHFMVQQGSKNYF